MEGGELRGVMLTAPNFGIFLFFFFLIFEHFFMGLLTFWTFNWENVFA